MPKISLKTIVSVILILLLALFVFIITLFIPRAEITYNCDGYNIYKMVTPLPSNNTLISIDKQSTNDGYFLYDNTNNTKYKSILFRSYLSDYSVNTKDKNEIDKIKFDYTKLVNCKDLNISILSLSKIGETSKPTDTKDLCYIINRTGETDYPECSPEIKAKFELK